MDIITALTLIGTFIVGMISGIVVMLEDVTTVDDNNKHLDIEV